jgi:hypothetical protein
MSSTVKSGIRLRRWGASCRRLKGNDRLWRFATGEKLKKCFGLKRRRVRSLRKGGRCG